MEKKQQIFHNPQQQQLALIYVSAKTNPRHYFSKGRKAFLDNEEIQFKSINSSIKNCAVAAQFFVDRNLAEYKEIKTDTIKKEDGNEFFQLNITLKRSNEFF